MLKEVRKNFLKQDLLVKKKSSKKNWTRIDIFLWWRNGNFAFFDASRSRISVGIKPLHVQIWNITLLDGIKALKRYHFHV